MRHDKSRVTAYWYATDSASIPFILIECNKKVPKSNIFYDSDILPEAFLIP